MINGIPRLSRANFSIAKRSVTPIDTLRGARPALVASVGAAPDRLAVIGEGAIEFECPSSRQVEMRSNGW